MRAEKQLKCCVKSKIMVRLELHRGHKATAELLQEVGAGCSNGFRVFRCLGYIHDPAKLLWPRV